MTAVLEAPRELAAGDPIAVVDDVDVDAEGTADLLEDADFLPIRIPLPDSIDALMDSLSGRVRGVVCDHRLSQLVTVSYDGAEVAARCRDRGLPAVLLTGWANVDEVASIRRWRDRIPRVLNKGTASSPVELAEALRLAQREVLGEFNPDRKAYRTVVRVARVDQGDHPLAEVFVTAWRPAEAVLVPAVLLTDDTGLAAHQLSGRRFLADVNIYAAEQGELYFRRFEVASDRRRSGWHDVAATGIRRKAPRSGPDPRGAGRRTRATRRLCATRLPWPSSTRPRAKRCPAN